MNDDPVSFLNLQEELAETDSSPGKWWLAALLFPVGLIGGGILLAFAQSGLGGIVIVLGGGILLGTILSVVSATLSFAKRERHRGVSLLGATPSALLLLAGMFFFASEQIDQWKAKQAQAQRLEMLQQVRADPEIVLREHWAKQGNPLQRQVLGLSVENQNVKYSVDQLERLYQEAPGLQVTLLHYPACPAEFLAAHVDEALAEAKPYSWSKLSAIIRHPNTPLPVLEMLAASKQLSAGALRDVTYQLKQRAKNPSDRPVK